MLLLDRLAEEKIRAAAKAGAFDNLPSTGKPLVLDDDRLVPEALRAGYRLLKNAGFLPPELQWRRELRSVEELLERTELTDTECHQARKRLTMLQLRLGESRLGHTLHRHHRYHRRILERLSVETGHEERSTDEPSPPLRSRR